MSPSLARIAEEAFPVCEVRGLNREKFNSPKYILTLIIVLAIKAHFSDL